MIIVKSVLVLTLLGVQQGMTRGESMEMDSSEEYAPSFIKPGSSKTNGISKGSSAAFWSSPKAFDYDHESEESVEDPIEMESAKRPPRETETLTDEEALRQRLSSLCVFPDQLDVLTTAMQKQRGYYEGDSSNRVKRQGLLGGLLGGTNTLGGGGLLAGLLNANGTGGLLGGLTNTNGTGGLLGGILNAVQTDILGSILGVTPTQGILETLLGTSGAVPQLLQNLLGNQLGNGLLGGLLNSVGGALLGQDILSNLLAAVTNLINEILNVLRSLLGLPTSPSLPNIGGGTPSEILALRIQALLTILNQFQFFAGNLTTTGNFTGGPTSQQFCFNLDSAGNLGQSNNFLNVNPTIIVNIFLLNTIFQSATPTPTTSTVRRICVTPDANGNIQQIVVDDTIIQRNGDGSLSVVNFSPTVDLNISILNQITQLLNLGGGSNTTVNDICFNVNPTGTFAPVATTGGLINISATVIANLVALGNILQLRPPTLVSGQTQTLCVRPSTNGGISQIIVNGNPVNPNPSNTFNLLNLDLNLGLNLSILGRVLQLLSPGGGIIGGGGSVGGGGTTNQICFDIPVQAGSSLVSLSASININISILGNLLGSRPTLPTTGATRRICVPVIFPGTTSTTTTTTTMRPPVATTTPAPIKRCYKKMCRHWHHTDCFRCHSKRNTEPEYKVVISH